ncbi:hypothetical protein [Streptomyces sp. NPDC059378]|uniref:hypothetical protein n=1 Tax=Streptomyces sp. NPDC059378 TaxID=3346815 RepID=UPI0036B688F9
MGIPSILNVFRHGTDNPALVTLTGEIDLKSVPSMHTPAQRHPHDGSRTIDVDVFALISAFACLLVRPRAQDRDAARRLEERLLAEHGASLGASLADGPDQPDLAALRCWDRTDVGDGRRAADGAVHTTLVLSLGVRTAARPEGLDRRAWTRWPP